MSNSIAYRPEIDGLRALSVISVLLYHYSLGPFSGGFVGVDVFFVISGYLITSIIFAEMKSGTFSVLGFYDRRVRRILPATLVTIICTCIAAYFILFPKEYAALATSSIYGAFGLANYYFLWNTGGYFDSAASTMPLLHLWSLGVEEQFYVCWPLILATCLRLSRGGTFGAILVLLAIIVLSFTASVLVTSSDQQVAFYMLPTRAWELGLGALLVFVPKLSHRLVGEALAISGFALIGLAVFTFTSKLPYPSYYALIPCAGAAMIVWPKALRPLSERPLENPIVVFVGKISFSLYLTHWPVLVIFKQLGDGPTPSLGTKLVLLSVAGFLAVLSWFLVERTFRQWRPPHLLTVSLGSAATVITALACSLIVYTKGLPQRLPENVSKIVSYLDYPLTSWRPEKCFLTSKTRSIAQFDEGSCVVTSPDKLNVLLLGDSHAAHFFTALKEMLPGANISQVNAAGCRPLYSEDKSNLCTDLNYRAFHQIIPSRHFDVIIVSGLWLPPDSPSIGPTAAYLSRFSKFVVMMGPSALARGKLPRLIALSYLSGNQGRIPAAATGAPAAKSRDAEMRALVPNNYVSIYDLQCPHDDCITEVDGIPLSFDDGHFTHEGAKLILTKLFSANTKLGSAVGFNQPLR
ncbi:MAG: acyltransferase [Mesorhizobium sp.]|nr:MAG: acyltransferase [Mesorhizobium sp.]